MAGFESPLADFRGADKTITTIQTRELAQTSGIFAIRESDSNASKTVLEKLGERVKATLSCKRRRQTNLLTLESKPPR
jgi:hypothetical protein